MYDEETDEDYCGVNMDEDDYAGFMSNKKNTCPYFIMYDEYKIVRKQN